MVISGLADDTETGNGTVTASDEFTVEPADAVCTAATAATGAKPKIAAGSAADKRVVSLAGAVPFSHIVTVRCDAAGRSATEAAVTLAGTPPAVSITGFDDSTPVTPSTAYASDKITVEPSTARCSGTAAGHGVGTPWVSSRTSTRTVVARVQPGGAATVTVTCTAAGHSPASAQALFSYTPRPQITSAATFAPKDACTVVAPDPRTDADADAVWQCSLDEGAALVATLTVVAGTYRVSDAWNTAGGITAKVRTIPAPVPAVGPEGAATDDWRTVAAAALRCTTDGAVAAVLTAGRRPGHRTHTTRIRIDCQAPVAISGLDDRTGYGKTGATVAVAEDFAVEPADATCTAAPTGTVTAPDPTRPHQRRLTADIDIGAAVTVTVSCTADRRAHSTQDVVLTGVAADCDSPLGSVVHGVTVRDGAIAADPGCVSAGRGDQGVFYARRHTFTLDAAARVTVDIAGEAGLDAYAVLYRGHDATAAAAAGRDDNSGPRSDARLRSVRLAAGDYTIEATTAAAQATGGYRLTVRAVYSSPVRISALADAANSGTGAVTITEPFTVTPAAAKCTASPPGASVAARSGRRRAVSATLDRPGPLTVAVTCAAAGRGPAAADVVLTHAGALTSITARVTGGGGECTATTPPRRVDVAYRCTIGRGNTVTVAADTTATGPSIETAWTATGAVSLASPAQRGAAPLFAPDNTVAGWQRTATVELECTAKGTATATATLPGTDAKKTARLVITCGDAVRIDGLADTTTNGTGTLTVTSGFTVTPPAAACTTDPTTATVTAGVGGARTLTASIAVPGSLAVTVTCKAAGHVAATRSVTLRAVEPCSDDLGVLAPGATRRSGAITEDSGCTSLRRHTPGASVFYARPGTYYARRHTFTLEGPARVTVELESAASNARRLDTYLVLLKGRSPSGTAAMLRSNNNVGPRAGTHRSNSRLSGVELQAGTYTIEATTHGRRETGGYDLAVSVATVNGLSDEMHLVQGRTAQYVFDYAPADAKVTLPTGALTAGITATLSHGGGSGTLTVTAANTGTYRARLDVAVPHSTADTPPQNTKRRTAGPHHAPAGFPFEGTVCTDTQAVVIGGDSVCAASSGYSLTITKTVDGGTVTVPASCVTDVPRGRWHLTDQSWPAEGACAVPHPNGDRPAQYFVFRVYDATANVTIRLGAVPSLNPQDTFLEMYQATGSQTVGGSDIVAVNLDTRPPSSRTNNDAGTGYRYLDGYATDSRLQLDLSRGVYVVAATVPPAAVSGTTVTAVGHFTINIKIPYSQPGS